VSRDEITVRLPRERPFFGVAHLVVGGFAARLDLNLEELEDLQVALAELLEQEETEDEITVSVRLEDGSIHALLGPFDSTLQERLDRADGDGVGLRRVLETVVDGVEVSERQGSPWVELRKTVR
jgi:anti-sigma regulatory factor (Ser/Thr protein kinase)